jgi:hypothetical protein
MSHSSRAYEWLRNLDPSSGPQGLNPRLTQWLTEYNFNCPHRSLVYLCPAYLPIRVERLVCLYMIYVIETDLTMC